MTHDKFDSSFVIQKLSLKIIEVNKGKKLTLCSLLNSNIFFVLELIVPFCLLLISSL